MRGLDSPWGLRVTGLVGVAVVAAGAYGAGALPGRDPGAGLRGAGTPGVGFWLGLAGWVVGLTMLSGAWWQLGKRLGAVGSRWLIVTGALWALPLLLAPPLASRDVYSYACQGQIWNSGLDPYAVGAVDGGCSWAGSVPDLWQHTPAPYGPVGVALSGAAAAVGRAVGGPAGHQLLAAVTVLRIVALIGGVLIAVYAGRLATATGIAPTAARWLGLLSPLVAVHLVSGAHNDALTAGLTVAALAVATSTATSIASAATATSTATGTGTGTGFSATGSRSWRWAATRAARIRDVVPAAAAAGPPVAVRQEGSRVTGEPSPSDRPATTGEVSTEKAGHLAYPGDEHNLTDPGADNPPWRAALAAGAFIGLAAAVKVTAVIALPFVILLVAYGWRTRRRATTTIGIAAVTVTTTGALVFAAASVATGLDLGWFGALSDTGSLVQWTSVPTGVGMAVGYVLRVAGWPGAVDTAVQVARICGIGALAVIGLALCRRALQATLQPTPQATPRARPTNRQPDETATELKAAAPATNDDPDVATRDRRQIVAAAGWTLAAAAILLPVFYPWYAIAPLAVLACATPPGRTRTAFGAVAIAITALIIPNGLGLAVLTKLPGAILDVAIVAAIAYRFRSRRSNRDEPSPARGDR